MRVGLSQTARMEQRLIQSPQMIQAMQILQLPALDLEERIEQELIENPFLEVAEAGDREEDGESVPQVDLRGEERRKFPWGPQPPECQDVMFGRGPNDGSGQFPCGKLLGPSSVRSSSQDRTSNAVFDLGGNVREWTSDWFLPRYPQCGDNCTNPVVDTAASSVFPFNTRVVRGGSWHDLAESCRAANRSRSWPAKFTADIGFRCVRSASP